jgi:hypothetical protein
MRAYTNIRFYEFPDVDDIVRQGRRSRVGRIPRGESDCPRYKNGVVRYADGTPGIDLNAGKIVHNDRGYCRPKHKAAVRRYLKRKDRAIENRFQQTAEND